ncbi:hypothetical protein CEXT_502231 [Caerostris extrusa]|uniref:Uncharacterized protein n=1 Tax=Caerostris extrusa TaxID=172846 RepID=A0AAV4U9B6_CAEEX|nr:hypothetical protein CEXT_502231 [Caerostris extrusa]
MTPQKKKKEPHKAAGICVTKRETKPPWKKFHLIPPASNPKANRERGLIMSPERRSKRTFVICSKHQDTRSTVDNSFECCLSRTFLFEDAIPSC